MKPVIAILAAVLLIAGFGRGAQAEERVCPEGIKLFIPGQSSVEILDPFCPGAPISVSVANSVVAEPGR